MLCIENTYHYIQQTMDAYMKSKKAVRRDMEINFV